MVTSQASAIWRTIAQWTWRQRRRPPPTPTTEEATTWVVETGAPTSERAEDHRRRRRLAGEPLDRLDAVDAPAHGPDDPPSAEAPCRR